MPRGKHFNSDNNEAVETVALSEAEQKVKTGAKVTLVKPAQEMEKAEPPITTQAVIAGDAPAAKKAPRPKVGRTSQARKKKSEAKDAEAKEINSENFENADNLVKSASSKTESGGKIAKEIVPSLKTETIAVTEVKTPSAIEASDKAKEKAKQFTQSVASESAIAPVNENLTRNTLREDLAQMEMTEEWKPEHSRPWSFKFILLCVALFVLVNLSFMSFFKVHHKTDESTTVSSAQTAAHARIASTPIPLPAVNKTSAVQSTPSAPTAVNTGISKAAALGVAPAPVTMAPQQNPPLPPAPLVTDASAPSAADKAANSQQLLSILDKN